MDVSLFQRLVLLLDFRVVFLVLSLENCAFKFSFEVIIGLGALLSLNKLIVEIF